MANPYSYYPEQGMLKPLTDIADTATRLYGIREHSRLSEGDQAMRSRAYDQQANYQNQDIAVRRERLAFDKAQQPTHKQTFKPSDYLTFQGATNENYGPEVQKALGEYYDFIKGLALKGMSKADAYEAAKSVFPAMQEKALEKLLKTDVSVMDPESRKKFDAFLDTFATDDGTRTLDQGWFVNTAKSIRQEQENSKAAIEGVKQAGFNQRLMDRVESNEKIAEARIAAAEARAGNKNQLSINDIKSAYGMEMQGIKNRMLVDMTPEEQANFANMAPEQLMAALMAGGKSLSPEKKAQYISEIQALENYYGGLTQQALGRKGAVQKAEKPPAQPKGPEVNQNEPEAVKYLKGAKSRDEAKELIRQLAAQGWSPSQLAAIAAKAGWE